MASKIDKDVFKLPTKPSVAGRASSITNAFIAAVMPIHAPTAEEVQKALAILGMTADTVSCAYCGGRKTEWDHLNPFVSSREPTGFFTSIYNLVPACGKCNQSKGNRPWLEWMKAKHAALPDFKRRVERLRQYEEWGKIAPIAIKALLGAEEWDSYMKMCGQIIRLMQDAELEARRLRSKLEKALEKA